MKSSHEEDRFLTIGEAARIWRVSPDSLRAWSRKGRLHPMATPGGRNRFRESELTAVLGNPRATAPTRSESPLGVRAEPKVKDSQGAVVPSVRGAGLGMEDPEVEEVRAELEITRARRQIEALRRDMAQDAQQAAVRAEAECVRHEEERRLEGLRSYGRERAIGLPVPWRQRVISLLEEFVNGRNLPASLSNHEARVLVEAKVQEVRDEWNARRSQELTETISRWRVQGLVDEGKARAASVTASWDPRDARDARAEVARDLEKSVVPDWSESDVRRRVEFILERWGEVDDEGDDEDYNEDEEDDEDEVDW